MKLLDSILVTPSDHLRDIPQSRRGRNLRAWVMLQGVEQEIVDDLRKEQNGLLESVLEALTFDKDWKALTRIAGKVQAFMMSDMVSGLRGSRILEQRYQFMPYIRVENCSFHIVLEGNAILEFQSRANNQQLTAVPAKLRVWHPILCYCYLVNTESPPLCMPSPVVIVITFCSS